MNRQSNSKRTGMKTLKWLAVMLTTAVLWACGGGGGNAGTSPFGGGTGTDSSSTAELLLELSKSTIVNTGSDSVIITATALDAGRATLSGAKVVVSADNDAIVTTPSDATGADGKLQSTLTIGSNRANRVVNVTVTSGAVTKTATVQVLGATLTATALPVVVAPSAAGKIQYRLLDQAKNPMVGQDIQVVAVGLTPTNAAGKTGVNGDFEFAYTAPATAGSFEVIATAGGATTDPATTISVQAASTVPNADMSQVTSASVSANPSVVGTNASATSATNISTIRALVLGNSNTPIQNVRVRFDLNGDVNTIGGTFSTGDTTLYTDGNGVVTTNYISSNRSSPTNGVTVRACFYGSDAEAAAATRDATGKLSNCPVAKTVSLTVTSEPLGVSIGTNELIIVNELTYVKKFIVSVVDAAGVAKPDVNLVVSVDLPQYRKGFYVIPPFSDSWSKTGALPSGDAAICANEDTNRNGVLETGENTNGAIPYPDGSFNTRLDPGKSDVSVTLLHAKTRADGTAELQLQYAKSFATWVDAKITVAASGVSGTEGRATYLVAPISADAASFKNVDVTPAFVVSPYGVSTNCANPN
jgi:hypothetical protein